MKCKVYSGRLAIFPRFRSLAVVAGGCPLEFKNQYQRSATPHYDKEAERCQATVRKLNSLFLPAPHPIATAHRSRGEDVGMDGVADVAGPDGRE